MPQKLPSAPLPSAKQEATLRQRVIYGMGGAADNVLYNGLSSLIFPIFNIGLGINAGLLGLLSAIPRFVDALVDPLVGHLSDNTRTRFGRRLPFILVGAVLAGALFYLLFLPGRGWPAGLVPVYYLAVLIVFYVAYAMFIIPHRALGLELSHNPQQRVKVLAWGMYLGLIAGFAIPFLYKWSFTLGGGDEVAGVKWVAAGVGLFVAFVGVLLFMRIKEPPVLETEHIPIRRAIAMTFRNRQFLPLAATTLTVLFGIFIAMPLVVYLNLYFVLVGNKETAALYYGYYQLATTLGGFIGVLLIPRLPFSHFSTAKTLIVIGAISTAASWWTFHPGLPWLQTVQGAVFGFAVNALFLLTGGFLGDVCDRETATEGVSRQGFYAASFEFAKKCAISLSTLASGLAITFANVAPHSVIQSPETPLRLRLAFLSIMTCAFSAAFVFFLIFEKSMQKKG